MVRLRLNNRPIAFRSALLAFLLLLSFSLKAQTVLYDEAVSGDLPGTGNGTALTISAAGTYTVSGTISSGADGQDRHQLTINSGLQLTAANYAIGGGGSPSGGQINWGGYANPTWGAGSSGSIGLTMPWPAGTYPQIMVAVNFSTGTTWTITYVATSTASAPAISTNPSSTSICAGGNASFTVAASNTPTSYQWQFNSGSGWANLSNLGVFSNTTAATMNITGASAGMNGYQFRATATNGAGTSSPSSAATLTVNSAPSITSNPANTSACAGGNASFTVAANNTPTSYQWQVDAGSGFTNLSNGGVYSNVTAATMNITGATAGMAGYQYRATATNGCGTSAASTAGTLTINSAPSVTTNPSSTSGCLGGNASFTVAASNTPTSYQWQLNTGSGFTDLSNGGIYSNVTAATLNITGIVGGMSGYQYRATATNGCGTSAVSSAASLTVGAAPTINFNPSDVSICSGANVSCTTSANNSPTSYQWQVNTGSGFTNLSNGGVYNNVTNPTMNIVGATPSMNGYQFRATATNGCGTSAASNVATLTVQTAATVNTVTATQTACAGGNATFTITTTTTSPTYIWYEDAGGGPVALSNGGIYSGVNTNSLALTGVTAGMNGYLYYCRVTTGTGCLPNNVVSSPGTLTVNTLAAVNTQPSNSTICSGTNTSFTVAATGAGIGYQWQLNTGAGWSNVANAGVYSNATTATLNITNAAAGMTGYQYRCYVTGTCNNVTSNAVTLTVTAAQSITTQPTNSTICAAGGTTFSVVANNAAGYQWYVNTGSGFNAVSNGGVYSGATTAMLTITGATTGMSTYQYYCIVSGNSPCTTTQSNTVTLTVDAPPVVNTQPSNAIVCVGDNTSFSVAATGTGIGYQWQVNTGSGFGNITNGGVYSNATTATLNITGVTGAMGAYQYRCLVTGTASCGNVTSNAATLTVNSLPSIFIQPNNSLMTVCALAGSASCTTIATGTGISFQWEENTGSGWNPLGANPVITNNGFGGLTFTNPPASMNGYQYRSVVSGTCTPAVTSNAVTLTVNSSPAIVAQALNSIICAGFSTSFSIATTGAGLTYQWQENTGSSWANITNGGVYSNATTVALGITAAPYSMNGYQYRCVVSGTCAPPVTGTPATLTVNSAAVVTAQPLPQTVCAGDNATFSTTAIGTNLTYQWYADYGSGFVVLTNGSQYSGVTTNTLSVTGANPGINGSLYQCRISTGSVCIPSVVNTTTVSLTVYSLPVIYNHPTASTICSGGNTAFAVTATGTGLTYQWQENTGSGFANITNGGIYSNATTGTLNLTGATVAMNTYQYRCVVSGTCPPSVTSNAAVLTVNSLPAVSTHPSNVTLCAGATATFTVAATGAGLTYQWQENTGSGFVNLVNTGTYFNVSTPTLSVFSATAGMNTYQYRCVVSGTCSPAATSNPATLTVNTAPAVTAQPVASVICLNGNTSYSVTATGTAVTYQWQLSTNGGGAWSNLTNTGVYSNVTTNSMNITAATAGMTGSLYRCVVSGTCAPVATSFSALLTVNIPPAVSAQPSNVTVCNNGNISFTVGATGTALTYQWQQDPGTGFVNLTNGGAVTGATSPTLNIVAVTTAMNTYQYRCVVSGTCAPVATSNNAVLTVNPMITPSVSIAASATAICSGTSVTFTATPTNGGTTPVYVWKRGTTTVGTNSTTYTAANFLNGEVVTCQMTSNAACITTATVASNAVTMNVTQSVTPSLLVTTPNNPVCSGSTVLFTAIPTNGGSTPAYQWRKNGSPVGTGATTYSDNTLVNGDVISCVLTSNAVCATTTTANSNNIAMGVNPIVVPAVSISTSSTTRCAGQSTTFTATPTNGGTSPTYQWQVNGFTVGTNSSTYTTTTLNNGDVVNCVLISNAPCPSPFSATSNSLTMTVIPLIAPTIAISSDFGTQACQNVATTFTAVITNGGPAPIYQWRRNGSPVGTNSATYVAPTLNNGDVITCVLASSAPCATPSSVTSNSLTMTVNPVGKATVGIFASPDSNMCVPSSGLTFYSNYTNGGSTPAYQWRINGIPVLGATSATFFATSLQDLDAVTLRFSSSAICVFPEISSAVTIHQYPVLKHSVNITMTNVGPGQTQFTANIINGGATPSVQWYKNDKAIPTATSLTHTESGLTSSDRISVEVISTAICATPKSLMSNYVSVTTGIHNVAQAGLKFGLYPNPVSTDRINLIADRSLQGETVVRLINKLGQLVSEHKVNIATGAPTEIVIGDIAAGTYYLQVINTTENIKTNIKFDKN